MQLRVWFVCIPAMLLIAVVSWRLRDRWAGSSGFREVGKHVAIASAPENRGLVNASVSKHGTWEPIGKAVTFLRPDLWDNPGVQRITADASPAARTLFVDGLDSMHNGKFAEARDKLERLIKTCSDEKIAALASWTIALAYYQEGGLPNLNQAANQFMSFSDAYGSDKDLQEFVQSAMFDAPVVLIDVMHQSYGVLERDSAGLLAAKKLNAFLARWPDSPQVPEALAALKEVSDNLSGVK